MDTVPAFYDDHFHCLRAAIEGGRGYKATAQALWPSMKPDSAYARLKNSTQSGGDHKLDLAEVRLVCKVNGCFDPLYWLCDETLHERPKAIQAEEAARSLAQHIEAVSGEFTRSVAKLEALARANPSILKSVA